MPITAPIAPAQPRFAKSSLLACLTASVALGAAGLLAFASPAEAGPRWSPSWTEVGVAKGYKTPPRYQDRGYDRHGYQGGYKGGYRDGVGYDLAGCRAGAKTMVGSIVPRTKEQATHRKLWRACEIAMLECRTSLDNIRAKGGFTFPLARCKVLERTPRIAAAPAEFRCVARAFTSRGKKLKHTRATATRTYERLACDVAMDRCEARLEKKRRKTGRSYRYSRCEVTLAKEIAVRPGYEERRRQEAHSRY